MTEAYLAEQSKNKEPVTFQGLRQVLGAALEKTFGKPQKKRSPTLYRPRRYYYVHFIG